MSILTKKSILVTGGTGSIGTALVEKAITDNAKLIRIFSNDENGLYEMESKYGNYKNIEYVIGNIQNSEIVSEIVKGIDIVFHAAALKHVDRCELNPLETINVNIMGTKNITKSAKKEKIQRMIFISTDKAVNPIGVMGATKLLGEKLLAAEALDKSNTIFASVRFGNVFHTRGSILPRIEKQISNGGPITLTNPEMKRFFMTKDDAINLIISAATVAKGGETFVLKMPLIRLDELFEAMKDLLSSKYNYTPSQIKTKIIGTRPGEKLIEYLLTEFEIENVFETKDFFIIPPLNMSIKSYPNAKKLKNPKSYFKEIKTISKNEIIKLKKNLIADYNLNNLRTGLEIKFTIDKSNNKKITTFIFPVSRTEKILLTRNLETNLFEKKKIITNLIRKIIFKEGKILQSLYKTAIDLKVQPNIIIEFARIYGFQVDFQRDIRKNKVLHILMI